MKKLMVRVVYPNGLTASWAYDANGQLLQVKNAFPTNIISQYDYVYDAAGRRINVSKSGSAFDHGDTISYGYNARSELTNTVAAIDSDYRYSYAFDDIGNRETSSERGTNSVYTANNLNQYTAVDDFTPQFDDDGNQTLVKTATGIWSVTYNGENRPVLWSLVQSNNSTNTNNQTILSMSYDRMGRRVAKNDQRFVYDGYLQIADYLGNKYIWDASEPVATRPIAWNSRISAGYYAHDGNKNVSEVLGGGGEVKAHYAYAPYGAIIAQFGEIAVSNPWRFSCEYAEEETSTIYYNYRYYVAIEGCWMSADPVGHVGGLNLHGFVGNQANNNYDTIGLLTTGTSITGTVWYYGDGAPLNYGLGSDGRCEKDLTYVADSPGFDLVELGARITHPGYIDLNSEGDFDPNAELKTSCECIRSIMIIAHGEEFHKRDSTLLKHRSQWGSTDLYEGAKGSQYDSITGLSDQFKNIRFCKKCVIEIRTCWSGAVKGLAERIVHNSRILDNRIRSDFHGCEVIVYDEQPNIWGLFGRRRRVNHE